MLYYDQIFQGKYNSSYNVLNAMTDLDQKPLCSIETTLDLFSLITFYIYSLLMVSNYKQNVRRLRTV